MHQILLVCLLWLGGAQETAPALGACATCNGKGMAVFACEACADTGKGECRACKPKLDISELRAELKLKIVTEAADLEEIRESVAKFDSLMGNARSEWLANLARGEKKGHIKCPSGCIDGKVMMSDKECKLCSKSGSLKCNICKGKGVGPCTPCAGKSGAATPCPQCMGRGETPTLANRTGKNLAVCPWCNDARTLECMVCDHEFLSEQPCKTCAATGHSVCKTCKGSRRAKCKGCSSSGVRRTGKCDECKGKGFSKCADCTKGLVTCVTCEGKLTIRAKCTRCFGGKKALCHGCYGGSGRAWIVTAERLIQISNASSGLAHVREAVRREELSVADRIRQYAGDDKERRAYERDIKKQLAAFRKRAKAVEKTAQ